MHMYDARTGCRGCAHGFGAFGCAPRDGLPAAGELHHALHRISETNESSFKTLECVHVDADA